MTGVTLQQALAIDVCTVVFCALVAKRCAASLLHSSTVMLGAHLYIVTLRLSQLARGYAAMQYSFDWPLGEGELVRAALCSDAALMAMAAGWLVVRYWGARRSGLSPEPRIQLSASRVRVFAIAALCLAAAGMAIVGPHAQREVMGDHSSSTSGYLLATTGWAGWCFCLLHFLYGFRWPLMFCTAGALLGTMLLSTFRGAVIIPCVFLLFTWLARREGRGLPWGLVPAVILLWLLWLPMKPTVYGLQQGRSPADAIATGVNTAFTKFGEDKGSGIDFQFLDMVASTMTLVDVHDSFFFGTTISPIFVAPFPRQVWPGKPEPNQYQQDLDIPARPMAKLHMTAGLVGESYANFGYLGIVLIPFTVSVVFSATCKRLAGTSLLTPGSLLYLLYLSTYMQLYRDGLISAVWFPFVHCAPVGWVAVSHWMWPPRIAQPVFEDGLAPSLSAQALASVASVVRGGTHATVLDTGTPLSANPRR